MKNLLAVLLGLSSIWLATNGYSGTAPQQINYQAKVEQSGVPFDGVGKFKFAIVDQTGTNTFWSNDGTSTNGTVPTATVSLNVKGGILSVRLGDAAFPNMTPIPASVFLNPDTWMRVWFGGAAGASFEKLAPDSKLASVPYAMVAETVPSGAITGDKLARESVWPQHEGRNDCVVAYFAENYDAVTGVNFATIATNKNFVITDVHFSNLDTVAGPGLDHEGAGVEIRYTKDAVDTILLKSRSSGTRDSNGSGWGWGFIRYPVLLTFRSGLAVPAGATLKVRSLSSLSGPQTCTVAGYEIPVQ